MFRLASDINAQTKDWVVSLKVLKKSGIIKRSNNTGTYMIVDVEDAEGTEARMVAHNALAKKFESKIQLGCTYKISNCALKVRNKMFSF